MPRSKNKNAKISDEEKKTGSRKCVLKAIQLIATLDELGERQIPVLGWTDENLDKTVRTLEVDHLSDHINSKPGVDVLLPQGYGFTSLVYETFISQAVLWWAKAQYNSRHQNDKCLREEMYAYPIWHKHFMKNRNNQIGHFSNEGIKEVPGVSGWSREATIPMELPYYPPSSTCWQNLWSYWLQVRMRKHSQLFSKSLVSVGAIWLRWKCFSGLNIWMICGG